MKKKLVTIKQAELLKKLGFNEKCNYYAVKDLFVLKKSKETRSGFMLVDKGKVYTIIGGTRRRNNEMLSGVHRRQMGITVPTVDEAIDWLREKHDVIIYDRFEPVVDPVKKGRIMYCHAVKFCDRKHGWNFRESIDCGIVSNNVYTSKRYAINKALKYIEKKNAARKKRGTNRKR